MGLIVCLVAAAVALIAILLIVILCLMGKKAYVPLGLFALCVVAMLVSGQLPSSESGRNDQASTLSKQTSGQNAVSSGGISTDKGVFNVTVTIPSSLLQNEDLSNFDEAAYAKDMGFSKAVLNPDGSITITMSKSRHKDLLEETATEYDKQFSELVNSDDTPYIKSINRSDNFGEIVMEVDRAAYEDTWIDVTPLLLGISGMMYQTFSGGPLHVEIIVADHETGEELHSVIYPDAFGSSAENNADQEVPSQNQDTGFVQTSNSSGTLGDYSVEIKDAVVSSDYSGDPAIIITYSWTNNSEDTTSAEVQLMEKAFQAGVQLDTAYIGNTDVFDSGLSFKELRPGTTLDVQCAFLLLDDTSVVEFELTKLFSFSDDVVAKNFDPTQLK